MIDRPLIALLTDELEDIEFITRMPKGSGNWVAPMVIHYQKIDLY